MIHPTPPIMVLRIQEMLRDANEMVYVELFYKVDTMLLLNLKNAY